MKTTLEKVRENKHQNITENLQTLLEKNYEAEQGFRNAMELAEDNRLKGYLKQKAAQRARFATELDKEIRNLNETPTEGGSAKAALHRAWMDVKTTFSGDTDEAVLEECIRGEKSSMEAYEETLKENNFPAPINEVISKQADEIKGTLNTVKRLEDIKDNWS